MSFILNPFRFQNQETTYNTFIGGVGASYITSPADFVAKTTGLVEADVENFTIDSDNNVSLLVTQPYIITAGEFNNLSELTWYLDVEGNCTSAESSFNTCSNLLYLYLPELTGTSASANSFQSSTNILKANFQGLTELASRGFLNGNDDIEVLRFPIASGMNQASNVTYYNMANLTSLRRLDIRSLTTFNTNALNNSILGLQFLNINSCDVYYNSALGVTNRLAYNYINLPSVNILTGDKFYIDGRVYECVAGSPSTDGEFQYDANVNTLRPNFRNAMNSDTRSGASDFTYTVFSTYIIIQAKSVGTSFEVSTTKDGSNTGTADFKFSTLIGGNDVHPLLIYFRDERSCVLVETSTPISVPEPTGLSYSNITANTVDLDFTEPTPNANGTDCFEVWVDDGTVYRKWFEFKEIAGDGATLNLDEVIADVGSLSGVKIKIRTMDGQMNYSDFSNEITLP